MCKHNNTHYEDWPDGGAIEICDDCGMSRYIWEQGESGWVMVDLLQARKELKEGLQLYEPFSSIRCCLCEDYYELNPSLFDDCPACDIKADREIGIIMLMLLHLHG